ncbi:type IV pilin [Methanolobus psychrotolerans]|uniref:type IV pilin n=1 Tax=Methanolobus psychrotolerans TaxID=1874706 RepID=UPI000B91A753|nr:type IV pilin N-terminal domain-containing protein [Methanolobus psychrotolerans]
MSKANQFLDGEDAVSPVIGVILMVAITVILAAVIAAFVFGMGPPEQAPQASVRASSDTANSLNVVKLEHQGGDAIVLTAARTKVVVDGVDTDLGNLTSDNNQFDAGETLTIYFDGIPVLAGTSLAAGNVSDDIGASGETVNVKFIDVTSQQMIADMDVRF